MPLVPQPVYAAWFSRQSWVFKQFSYLFVNPLWQRPVPKGFSLCPYWWGALAAFFVLRPLVYLTLGLRAVARALGLVKLLEATDTLFVRCLNMNRAPLGLNTAVGLIIIAAPGTFVGMIVYHAALGLAATFAAGCLSPFVALIASLTTALACGAYASAHKDDSSRCRVEIYTHLVLGLSLATVVVLHPGLFLTVAVGWPIAAFLWTLGALAAAAGWLWDILVLSFVSIVSGSIGALIGLALVGVLGLIGWWTDRLGYGPFARPVDEPARPKLSKEQIQVNLRFIGDTIWTALHGTEREVDWHAIRVTVPKNPTCRDLAGSSESITEEQAIALTGVVLADIAAQERRLAQRSETCKRATAALARLVAPATAVLRQLRILGSYLWALVKARKAKACPFLMFQE